MAVSEPDVLQREELGFHQDAVQEGLEILRGDSLALKTGRQRRTGENGPPYQLVHCDVDDQVQN